MSTNFQNLFQADSNFQSDLDALLEHDENAQLVAGQAGAGAYGFGQPYTIGFGFDVSKQSGQAIISDFNAAGISLIINGKNVTSDLQNYNTSGTGKTSLATVNTDFQGLTINLEQALDLLNDVIPQYENGSTTLGLPGLIRRC